MLRVLGMTATKLTAGTVILYTDLERPELVPVFCWTREVIEEVLRSGAVRVVGVVDGEGRIVPLLET